MIKLSEQYGKGNYKLIKKVMDQHTGNFDSEGMNQIKYELERKGASRSVNVSPFVVKRGKGIATSM